MNIWLDTTLSFSQVFHSGLFVCIFVLSRSSLTSQLMVMKFNVGSSFPFFCVCVCCRSIHRKWPRAVFGLSPARTAMKMRTCSAVSLSPSALRDPVSPCLRSCTLLHTHVCSRDCLAQLSDWMSHIIVRRSVHVTICSLLWLPLRNNRYVDTMHRVREALIVRYLRRTGMDALLFHSKMI